MSEIRVDTVKNRAGTSTITTADITNAPAFEATRVTSDQTFADNTYVKLEYNSAYF